MAVWIEDSRKDSFKICLKESKIFDGVHKNIKVVSNVVVTTPQPFQIKRVKVFPYNFSEAIPKFLSRLKSDFILVFSPIVFKIARTKMHQNFLASKYDIKQNSDAT